MILPANRRAWPRHALDAWAERAAIREYLGRMRRPDAEREAEADVRRDYSSGANQPAHWLGGAGK